MFFTGFTISFLLIGHIVLTSTWVISSSSSPDSISLLSPTSDSMVFLNSFHQLCFSTVTFFLLFFTNRLYSSSTSGQSPPLTLESLLLMSVNTLVPSWKLLSSLMYPSMTFCNLIVAFSISSTLVEVNQ